MALLVGACASDDARSAGAPDEVAANSGTLDGPAADTAPTTTLGFIAGRTSTTVPANSSRTTATARAPESLYADATPIADVVGVKLFDSGVLGLSCIPSRVDPVGTFFDFVIGEIEITADMVLVMIERQDVRFGSHPSGCRSPAVMPGQSWFLLGPDLVPLFASAWDRAEEQLIESVGIGEPSASSGRAACRGARLAG